MKTQDVPDSSFKQEPIILIKEEKKMEIMKNPIYYPILASLREGPKTVKEIEEDSVRLLKQEAKKMGLTDEKDIKDYISKRKRSDKSLYRYIQHLIELNYVALWGKRVAMDKPMTEKLFARTAKFFFVEDYYENMICEDPNCIESMSKILGLIYDIPNPDEKQLEKFTSAMKKSFKDVTNTLFREKPDEFVKNLENLSLSEVTDVIQTVGIINLVKNSEKYAKLLESLEN
jgi:hypothetical protein